MAFNVTKLNDRNTNYRIVKGDTFMQYIHMYTDDMLLYLPEENDQIIFSVFNKYTDTTPIFERVIEHDMHLTISAEETAQMKLGTYVYTIKLIYADGVVDTFLNGTLSIVTAEGVS